jgi:Cof subfamily protein (haloacid dehalogenase superfamily)
MGVRLIAIDIDGTLLDSRSRLPDRNLAAINAAAGLGVHLVLATGRSFRFARPIAEPLPPSVSLLVSNGALIKSTAGDTLLRRLLPRSIARKVLDATLAFRDTAALVFDRTEGAYVVFERIDWDHPNRKRYYEKHRAYIEAFTPLEDSLVEDPIQVMFNGGVSTMRALMDLLQEVTWTDEIHVALTEYRQRDFSMVDVMAAGCSKGTALADLTRILGFERNEVMAVGDNFNDVQMLEFAGLPIVMGNADPGLKRPGWHVTATHDEAGLADAIEKFVLR